MAQEIGKSMDDVIYVGIGVFIIVLLGLMIYYGYGVGNNQLKLQNPAIVSATTSTASANNQNAILANTILTGFTLTNGNVITLSCSGSCAWLNGNSTQVTISGWAINNANAGATNTIFANTIAQESQTFTVTNSLSTPVTVTTQTGNFFTINSVTISLTSIAQLNAAYPSMTFTAAETTNSVTHGSAPAAFGTNTITGSTAYTLALAGVSSNFTTYVGQLPNTYGNVLNLVIFALAFIAVILAIVLALKGTGRKSGGFMNG